MYSNVVRVRYIGRVGSFPKWPLHWIYIYYLQMAGAGPVFGDLQGHRKDNLENGGVLENSIIHVLQFGG